MFKKILIANRGEIACRIMKTAQQMGIHCVAVYSTADRDSLHVKQADSAFCVGEPSVQHSYLNIEAILQAAKTSGAEAIHPGYGFLSENPLFAQACLDAHIVFIGPPVAAMKTMASKQVAKQLLEQTQVPLTPGYHGSQQDNDYLLTQAKRLGFPLLLKAANGGGGKGMRVVDNLADFLSALAAARREAKAYFGEDTIILEKLLEKPRHIEVQIMADNHGQIVHLFERECSIQRRHQKIIEEAPAPALSQSLRQQLVEAACEVARVINYRGAGTVEFLVDLKQQFYFMEMNTRLQVEHPVTECITGLDLVAWQLAIAANQRLPSKQTDITAHGHAIECRIYAEDPGQNFLPSTGKIHCLQEPSGPGIRVDSGVMQDAVISMHYDPMLAKLISWGETREQALQRMQYALTHYMIGGIKTNLGFLQTICQHPRFMAGALSTSFLAEETLELPACDAQLGLLLAASYDYLNLIKQQTDPLLQACFAWQLLVPTYWDWQYLLQDQIYRIRITPLSRTQFVVSIDQKMVTLSPQWIADQLIMDDGQQLIHARFYGEGQKLHIYLEQGTLLIERHSGRNLENQPSSQAKQALIAPMPGTIVAILKQPGEQVKTGDGLVVLEAMKMEHTIHAPWDGILSELFYALGAPVQEGAELLALSRNHHEPS